MWNLKRKKNNLIDLARTELIQSLNVIIGFEQLATNISTKLSEIFNARNISILLYEPIRNCYINKNYPIKSKDKNEFIYFLPTDNLIKWLNVNNCILDIESDFEVLTYLKPREIEMIRTSGAQLIVPLTAVNRLIGALFVSEKNDLAKYTQDDLSMFTVLSQQVALALEHSLILQFQEERLKKILHTDRLSTIGELASGAAHEIRNPLTAIRSAVQFLSTELFGENKNLALNVINEIDRIEKIIKGLLEFGKSIELEGEIIDITKILDETLLLLNSESKKNNVVIGLEVASTVQYKNVKGDQSKLKQVFINILLNSLQAMPKGGNVKITLTNLFIETEIIICITIVDNGVGIPEDVLSRVFDPFFTTKDTGTGLGLSISYGIIVKHGGEIELKSKTQGIDMGTQVIIKLPIYKENGF